MVEINDISKRMCHPLKTTALKYLKEAIEEERFEMCQQIIQVAKEFGADRWEIKNSLILRS